MKRALAILLMSSSLTVPAMAQQKADDHSAHHPSGDTAKAPAAAGMADGEVRRVDKAAGKVTLRHGPIPNIDMPPMTMVFQVKDATLLDRVKAGDKVKFAAEKDGSNYTVTAMEVAK